MKQKEAKKIVEEAFIHKVDGVKMKTVFKDHVCRADKYGRPMTYIDPKTQERYVIRIAEKGQACRIIRELKRGMVEIDYILASKPDKDGNNQYRHMKEKVNKDILEEVKA